MRKPGHCRTILIIPRNLEFFAVRDALLGPCNLTTLPMLKKCSSSFITSSQILGHIFSDGKNDEEYVTQYCGGVEDPRFEYEEGCDTIDVPYGTEKCYCRTGREEEDLPLQADRSINNKFSKRTANSFSTVTPTRWRTHFIEHPGCGSQQEDAEPEH